MNNKFLKVTFVAAITLVSGINVFNSHKTETLSDVVLANVEALAMDEANRGITCYFKEGGTAFLCRCTDCKWGYVDSSKGSGECYANKF